MYGPPSPSKSIYDLVRQEIKVPDGLLFRGKYVAKTRNNNFGNFGTKSATLNDKYDTRTADTISRASRVSRISSSFAKVHNT